MDEPTSSTPAGADDPCPRCGQPVGDAWMVCAWCGEQLAAPAELAAGALLAGGRYQILDVMGRGGFGITYEAGDTRLKRRVAVKELFPDAAVRHGSMVLTPPHARVAFRDARDRFLREARVLARFTHPGIVRVYEVFEEHGTAYLVMERLGGRTLVDVLRGRGEPFTPDELVDVAGRVGAALRPIHAAGVLHRDVNPSNVMLTDHGRIVVIDFGLARDFDLEHTVGMTRVVTPGYAPLEQYRGEGRFGPFTDVYGLAATLYRLGTGKVPVGALERDGGAELPAPHKVNPAITKAMSDAILDGLELEPAHRPQDIDTFLARLGVRRLPDAPRSILLGAPGAELVPDPDDGPLGDLPPPPTVRATPEAPPGPMDAVAGLADPGPVVERRSALPTELVGPRAMAAGAIPASPAPAPVPAPADATLPEYPGARPAAAGLPGTEMLAGAASTDPAPDPDRTAVPAAPVPLATLPAPVPRLVVPAPADPSPPGPLGIGGQGGLPTAERELRPLTAQVALPGSEGGYPLAVGPNRPGRRKLLIPLFALAVATASAAPLLVTALIVLFVLPAIATLGDVVALHTRRQHGLVDGGVERRMPAALLTPMRFVRNMTVAVFRASPIIGIGAVLLAAWYGIDELGAPQWLLDVVLRLVGGGVVAMILLTAREGSARFRTGLGLDELVRRAVPGGRTSERVIVGWLLVAIVIAAALWLSPDAFPLP